ncbi:DUF1742-domain-containing protein [Nadsonia fulvescens var. elongata DSM 6958]|uniref:DUF1742-domain-containing protein n=1 Tax=Nadsonia fulvescens var. elongata DSM 6958 TaxID=857566 RepID=A0A1E3PJJ7_9ASCO|nr:DUF1742-domain-containing protein [Nadsonia fulvescens var. elongata DSM 6958]
MSTSQFKNLYHLRKVAESSAKACFVCYKPSSTVLVASDGKSDFFYVCQSHLADPSFAQVPDKPAKPPQTVDKEALDKEIEILKKRWAEKQTKNDNSNEKDEKETTKDEKEKTKDDKEPSFISKIFNGSAKSDKIDRSASPSNPSTPASDVTVPAKRVFVLNKDIFALRVQTHRSAKRVKQHQQMLAKPNLFPSVPTTKLE